MKQAQRVLSTYSVDIFGICSALYELGGLVVIHDASGCNSTYTTHNEPRWYDIPSMVYLSGLNEIDTIYGSDSRLIRDIKEVSDETRPKFISIGGSPMPNVIGTDFKAVARMTEKATGVPTLGFRTDGIHSYVHGAGEAFLAFAKRFMVPPEEEGTKSSRTSERPADGPLRVNLLGATPLDFSVTGTVTELKTLIRENEMELVSTWAMGDTAETLASSCRADVNVVISSTGYPLARWMEKAYGIPCVTGFPVGEEATGQWIGRIRAAGLRLPEDAAAEAAKRVPGEIPADIAKNLPSDGETLLIIGEPVAARSFGEAAALSGKFGEIRFLCPITDAPRELTRGMMITDDEHAIRKACEKADRILADPIYGRLLPDERDKFVFLPHDAFSGRYYRDQHPVFAGPDAVKNILGAQKDLVVSERENKIEPASPVVFRA
jgi:nitrogenase molybdenum-cofactor synthesis protein NifE